MKPIIYNRFISVFILICVPIHVTASGDYPWLKNYHSREAIANRIAVPNGFDRVSVLRNSFEHWLRYLPLKPSKPPIYFYDGRKKANQSIHHAVIDIDVGNRDLQQCADAVIRLRAEYLYSTGNYAAILFHFTSGDQASYQNWRKGYRPFVRGNQVKWRKTHGYDSSHETFRKYTETVFMYAGSYSLSQELKPVNNINDIQIGDVFIKGGFPGHAVIVVDMAVNKTTSQKIFLLAQSYMPAQDVHILTNPSNAQLSPWYELDLSKPLQIPEWTFRWEQLKRF
jgi:hypothetical protein